MTLEFHRRCLFFRRLTSSQPCFPLFCHSEISKGQRLSFRISDNNFNNNPLYHVKVSSATGAVLFPVVYLVFARLRLRETKISLSCFQSSVFVNGGLSFIQGILLRWTKGFKASGCEGRDVITLLKEAVCRSKVSADATLSARREPLETAPKPVWILFRFSFSISQKVKEYTLKPPSCTLGFFFQI